MKAFPALLLLGLLSMPVATPAQQSPSQSKGVRIELARENPFVVKMMDVINQTGKKMINFKELTEFDARHKQFMFKTAAGKLKKIPARDIQRISFIRLRQGVLTGKSQKLRVIAWNGNIANLNWAIRMLL